MKFMVLELNYTM